MKLAAAGAAMMLVGCAPSSPLPADAAARFDPVAFFNGHTHGDAILQKAFSPAIRVRVDSLGRADGHGGLILDQAIREGDKPARHRRWRFRANDRGGYTGSLTDAFGPVDFVVAGPRASIKYRLKHGLVVHQQLALQRDRHLVINRLIVTKFGVRVATLDEQIRHPN